MFNISKNKCVGCELCRNVCPNEIMLNKEEGRAIIVKQDSECLIKAIKICPQNAIKEINEELIIAIGTDDNKTIKSDDHVGMSKYFQIWRYLDGKMDLIETRENSKYKEDETRIHGDPNKAKATSSVLQNVDVIVGKIMGPNIVKLKNKFVPVIIRKRNIIDALNIIKTGINEIIEEKEKKERKGIVLQ